MIRFPKEPKPAAIRTVDLSQPLQPLTDVERHDSVHIFVKWQDHLLGAIDIINQGHSISVMRLRQTIADQLTLKVVEPGRNLNPDYMWGSALALVTAHYAPAEEEAPLPVTPEALPDHVPVSVVLATRDRPDDLRQCLQCLRQQVTSRPVEIVVVDNNPDSGLTPPVMAEFPEAVLVTETRKGLSYARNAGFVACTGDIAIATDDDVTMDPHWLEKLVAPFARGDVMAVTGNVLPRELETVAQHLFETYGGLGRGFEPFEVNGDWFNSFGLAAVPTWNLGATANAAFRTTIFSHPEIGLLDEALGVGTPTGCSEDTYLFYKILKAGYTLVYEPAAYVWHTHRRDMAGLRRQIYNYSKGHVAYHLTTLLNDRDFRVLPQLLLHLPRSYFWRIRDRLRGWSIYPLSLIWLEMLGSWAGPWALWQSRRRVKREGRSDPYTRRSPSGVTSQEPSLTEVRQRPTIGVSS